MRLGYRTACAAHPDIDLVGQADSSSELLRLIGELNPDVVTIDADLPGSSGIALAARLRTRHPAMGLVVTGPADDEPLFQSLQARLSGYLTRTAPIELLMSAVRHAASAPTSFTAQNLADALTRRHTPSTTLSPRENEILRQLNTGGSMAAIASRMKLTESTVRTYVARIYHKLGVHNRAHVLQIAAQHHLI
jgi:DNA-binding NarL/FixJ family response regulator